MSKTPGAGNQSRADTPHQGSTNSYLHTELSSLEMLLLSQFHSNLIAGSVWDLGRRVREGWA